MGWTRFLSFYTTVNTTSRLFTTKQQQLRKESLSRYSARFLRFRACQPAIFCHDQKEKMVLLDCNWCFTSLPVLKWLQIVSSTHSIPTKSSKSRRCFEFCSVIIIVLIERGGYTWQAYGFILFAAVACLLFSSLTLLLYFCQFHKRIKEVPWQVVELVFNVTAAFFFLIACGLGIYDCVKMYGRDWSHHNHPPPSLIGPRGWRNRLIAATAFSAANTVFYLLAALYTKRGVLT